MIKNGVAHNRTLEGRVSLLGNHENSSTSAINTIQYSVHVIYKMWVGRECSKATVDMTSTVALLNVFPLALHCNESGRVFQQVGGRWRLNLMSRRTSNRSQKWAGTGIP